MLYFSVLWMLKYSIGWRPSIWGGQIVSAIAEAVLDISLPIFFAKCLIFIYPLTREKILGWKFISFPWNRPLLFGFRCCARIEVALHELRLLCTDWGCNAQIEVTLHRLRLPCTDWAARRPAQHIYYFIYEQSEGRRYTFHLESFLYICGRIRNIINFQIV